MINPHTKGLEIFENFRMLEIPKDESRIQFYTTTSGSISNHVFDNTSTIWNVANQIVSHNHVHAEDLYVFQGMMESYGLDQPVKYLKGRFLQMKRSFKEFLFNPIKYFEGIKHAKNIIQNLEGEGEKNFEILLKQAETCHQVALMERLNREKKRIVKEAAMIAAGIKYFVPEEDLVGLTSKTMSRKLRLDWIKNFTRFIPEELQKIIDYTYHAGLFDNYVILHYDPKGKSSEMTEKERKKAADPILFGVIKDSRRLYYLGDWIDEYCDLTLDKLLDMVNKKHADKIADNILPTE